jgi:hypothetical protein
LGDKLIFFGRLRHELPPKGRCGFVGAMLQEGRPDFRHDFKDHS